MEKEAAAGRAPDSCGIEEPARRDLWRFCKVDVQIRWPVPWRRGRSVTGDVAAAASFEKSPSVELGSGEGLARPRITGLLLGRAVLRAFGTAPVKFKGVVAMRYVGIALLLLLTAGTGLVFGQETTGTIAGKIVDPQGLAMPGAAVTIKGTQGVKEVVTDEQGRFTAPFLHSG